MTSDLRKLAALLARRNEIENEISALIGRPALTGHVSEYIAAAVFEIELESSASNPGYDGWFQSGIHAGRSVNVKYLGKREGYLDIKPNALPELFLVLSGPKTVARSSRGATRPFFIDEIFLFEAKELHARLRERGVKIGVATSVRRADWELARVFPDPADPADTLSDEQQAILRLFSSERP